MLAKILEFLFSYFKSPNRLNVVEMSNKAMTTAQKSYELAENAFEDVRALREENKQLWSEVKEAKKAEERCIARLNDALARLEKIERGE